jgi:phage terminase small subunit
MADVELTEKQRIFCKEYILDWNGARAARVAGYSENTAAVIASENLTKPYIQAYIKDLQADIEKVAGISRLRVINEHIKLAFSSLHIYITRGLNCLSLKTLQQIKRLVFPKYLHRPE